MPSELQVMEDSSIYKRGLGATTLENGTEIARTSNARTAQHLKQHKHLAALRETFGLPNLPNPVPPPRQASL